jgi:cytochrome c oxidase assembly protein subunit 15
VTTLLLGVQIVLGGVVVGKDAGFICPDWPLCHGMLLPTWTGLVIVEMTHRITALLVAVLVLFITGRVYWKYRDNKTMMVIATLALLSLLIQMVVGGLIVLFKWPGVVTTVDVVNSMVLLSLYVALTTEAYRVTVHRRFGREWPDVELEQMMPTAWMVVGIGGFTVLVGALFRHTGAGEALFGINSYLASHGQHTLPSSSVSVGLLVFHITAGTLVAFAALWLFCRALHLQLYVKAASLLLGLVTVQFILGVLSLTSRLAFTVVTLHFANAGGMIATMTWVATTATLARQRIRQTADRSNSTSVSNPGTVH